nr:hypothetical protein [Gemmatimonadaceae bacterium]
MGQSAWQRAITSGRARAAALGALALCAVACNVATPDQPSFADLPPANPIVVGRPITDQAGWVE